MKRWMAGWFEVNAVSYQLGTFPAVALVPLSRCVVFAFIEKSSFLHLCVAFARSGRCGLSTFDTLYRSWLFTSPIRGQTFLQPVFKRSNTA